MFYFYSSVKYTYHCTWDKAGDADMTLPEQLFVIKYTNPTLRHSTTVLLYYCTTVLPC